jgi:hypothetical protein
MSNNIPKYSEEKIKELVAKKMEQIARERGKSSPLPAVPLNFSVEVHEHLTRAESDPASAMKLLEMLAKDLRAHTLPNRMLADYLADAIELAAAKRHNQALIALARRRCDVMYAVMRDGTVYCHSPLITA